MRRAVAELADAPAAVRDALRAELDARLTALDGLYLSRPLRPSAIIADRDVQRFMAGALREIGADVAAPGAAG